MEKCFKEKQQNNNLRGNGMRFSKTMLEVIHIMQIHGKLKRYNGGFWSWDKVEMKSLHNGGAFMCKIPIWHCSVRTLKALERRNIVILDEEKEICEIKQRAR